VGKAPSDESTDAPKQHSTPDQYRGGVIGTGVLGERFWFFCHHKDAGEFLG